MTLPTGIVARWKAADLGLTDGAAVGSWADSSGNGHTATQTTATKKPTYHSSDPDGFGTFPCVSFDGGDNLNVPFATALNNNPLTIAAVFVNKQASSQGGIYWWQQSGTARYGLMGHSSSGAGLFTGGASIFTTGDTLKTAYHVVTATEGTNAQEIFLDGSSKATGTATFTANTGAAGLIGQWTSAFWTGTLAELIHFDHVLTSTERSQWHSYVQDTYGVTVSDYTSSGSTSTGMSAQTVPSLTQTASGTVGLPTFTATSAQALPSLTQAAAGSFTGPPFTVTATPSGSDVDLSWTARGDAASYVIERDGQIVAYAVSGTTHTDTPGAGAHTYRVGVTL